MATYTWKNGRLEQDSGFQWNMWPVVPVSTVLMVCSIAIVAYEVEDMQVEVANLKLENWLITLVTYLALGGASEVLLRYLWTYGLSAKAKELCFL